MKPFFFLFEKLIYYCILYVGPMVFAHYNAVLFLVHLFSRVLFLSHLSRSKDFFVFLKQGEKKKGVEKHQYLRPVFVIISDSVILFTKNLHSKRQKKKFDHNGLSDIHTCDTKKEVINILQHCIILRSLLQSKLGQKILNTIICMHN